MLGPSYKVSWQGTGDPDTEVVITDHCGEKSVERSI